MCCTCIVGVCCAYIMCHIERSYSARVWSMLSQVDTVYRQGGTISLAKVLYVCNVDVMLQHPAAHLLH